MSAERVHTSFSLQYLSLHQMYCISLLSAWHAFDIACHILFGLATSDRNMIGCCTTESGRSPQDSLAVAGPAIVRSGKAAAPRIAWARRPQQTPPPPPPQLPLSCLGLLSWWRRAAAPRPHSRVAAAQGSTPRSVTVAARPLPSWPRMPTWAHPNRDKGTQRAADQNRIQPLDLGSGCHQ